MTVGPGGSAVGRIGSEGPDTGAQVASHHGKRHLLTIGLEDYFQVGAFHDMIRRREWYRFETRLERGTLNTLALLDEFGIRATFFALGWVADQVPEVIRMVAERGHEIANKGYYHRHIGELSPSEFRDDLARSREALQRASGQKVIGYRVADRWFGLRDLWALDVLVQEGYEYDSSLGPVLRAIASEPWRRFAHKHEFGDQSLWEFPISAASVFGLMIPVAGGNYFRQFPHFIVKRVVAHWMRAYSAPFVMYFHTWELDPDQPKISGAPLHQRIRQYRNLHLMLPCLQHYFAHYRFTGVADYLGIGVQSAGAATISQGHESKEERSVAIASAHDGALVASPGERAGDDSRTGVSIVVPCYNEEMILPYLANTLRSVEARLSESYDVEFILVDDGSSDRTWATLRRLFGDRANCRMNRHATNRGVARSILTGIDAASNEIVCSMDCDCTYDPHEFEHMIPLLRDQTELVTASPYHPEGIVRNVPRWRLRLSKGLSYLYRRVLHQKLHTYTSCFRVYRRETALRVRLDGGDFLGIAEFLGRLDLAGMVIAEFPTTLEVRLLGRSKMKILRTIGGHLRLLVRLAYLRLSGRGASLGPPPTRDRGSPLEVPGDGARV